MSDQPANTPATQAEEEQSVLFANLVMQQSSMAMMLMGAIAHPDGGKEIRDLEAAKLFVDQLEMLEAKTKGNLSQEESALLKQSLMNLRLAYVEAVNNPDKGAAPEPKQVPGEQQQQQPQGESSPGEESHKKFSKKY